MNEQPLTQEYCLQLIEDYKNGKADGTPHKYCELATFLDVNPVTISRWRAGRKMSEKTMRQIAFFCRKSAGALPVMKTRKTKLPQKSPQS
jgi:hypothetical protein